MTPLERLGLEVVAFNLLGSRSQAAVLLALMDVEGRVASYEHIGKARKWKIVQDEFPARNAIKVRICLLRESLEDIGLGGLIHTHEGHGYSLPEPGRTTVINRLIEEASYA